MKLCQRQVWTALRRMAAQGAVLQNHNNELVTCERTRFFHQRMQSPGTAHTEPLRQDAGIEELREKREALQVQIRDEELEKSKIQQDLQARRSRWPCQWPAWVVRRLSVFSSLARLSAQQDRSAASTRHSTCVSWCW